MYRSPLTLFFLTVSCMVGAGILVVPSLVMPYGFNGTIAWFLASACGLILGNIFATNAISGDGEARSIAQLTKATLGENSAYKVGFFHWVYTTAATALVTKTLIRYLQDFLPDGVSMGALVIVTVGSYFFAIRNGVADKIATISTLLKLCFFGITSLLGVLTVSRAKFFFLQGEAPEFVLRKIEPFVIAGLGALFVGSFFIRKRNIGLMEKVQRGALGIAFLFLICSNYDLFLAALRAANKTTLCSLNEIASATTTTLFAYAGLEFAAASPNTVKNPRTIPRITVLSILAASFVFISTYLFAINNLPSVEGLNVNMTEMIQNKPVKAALYKVIYGNIGNSWMQLLQKVLDKVISIIAIIGCLATCLAIKQCASAVLSDTICDLKTNRNETCDLRTARYSLVITSLMVALLGFVSLWNEKIVVSIFSYGLVYLYFYGVIASFKKRRNIFINFIGIIALLILLAGCSSEALWIATFTHFGLDIFYAILHRNS